MKEAVDAASQFPPFGGNDVYFTTHELTDSIKIHGKVYYDPDAYVGSGWSQHKLTRQEAQDMFLDSVTVEQVEKAIGRKITVVCNDGYDLVNKIVGE